MECPLWRLLISSRSALFREDFHRCFLPSFSSFGWGFSEEKIKMWKVNGWQTTNTKWWPDPLTNMAATGNYCFGLADLFKSSPLKPLGQMNRNLVGSIYERSFGWGFSEEKIKMWKVNGWQTTNTKWWQKFILPLARFAKKNIKMWIHFVGSIYGRSSIKNAHFVPIR
jgi:hypothetical protein